MSIESNEHQTFEIGVHSGHDALEILAGVVSGQKKASIAGYEIDMITFADICDDSSRNLVFTAKSGRSIIKFSFGSADPGPIDFSLQVFGK